MLWVHSRNTYMYIYILSTFRLLRSLRPILVKCYLHEVIMHAKYQLFFPKHFFFWFYKLKLQFEKVTLFAVLLVFNCYAWNYELRVLTISINSKTRLDVYALTYSFYLHEYSILFVLNVFKIIFFENNVFLVQIFI